MRISRSFPLAVFAFLLAAVCASGAGVRQQAAKPPQPAPPAATSQQAKVAELKQAAEAGDVSAMVKLGEFFEADSDNWQHDLQAAYWYRRAAVAGSAQAMLKTGSMYHAGVGVEKDESQAFEWYRKAADGGVAEAMTNLAKMYELGRGVPKDTGQAIVWYRNAAAKGDKIAKDALERLENPKPIEMHMSVYISAPNLRDGGAADELWSALNHTLFTRVESAEKADISIEITDRRLQPGLGREPPRLIEDITVWTGSIRIPITCDDGSRTWKAISASLAMTIETWARSNYSSIVAARK